MSSELSSPPPPPKASKSSKATKAKAPSTKSKTTGKTSKAPPAHPSWKDIVKECISAHPDDARAGVSRSTIKKYAEDTYGLEANKMNVSHLARAIASGVEENMFSLPKGPAGKVKLFKPKPAAASTTKENTKPPAPKKNKDSDAPVKPKKPAAKPATAKVAKKVKADTVPAPKTKSTSRRAKA